VTDEGLFHMYSPDPDWRNEADCGMAEYKRPDGSTLPLNCAGPKHAYFRCVSCHRLPGRGMQCYTRLHMMSNQCCSRG
jgi:hypothetical protein